MPYESTIVSVNGLPEIINSVIVNPLILRAGRNSPPAVNQPTLKARERFTHGITSCMKVSRSGVIPGPTVKVRMGESNDPAGFVPAHVIFLPLAVLLRLP
jgi:hypothetical protein